ncbi:MAG: DUF2304 family protein [Candidatus Bathyarchaeota archaeon]|nr:DUF2304 family protein [Candidatus Bathyarchaeota archaeon]
MPYCQKCGNEIAEEMKYCPKCGASVKAEMVTREPYERREKQEKQEKQEKHEKHEKGEKQEKQEKHEKEETSVFWVLVAGLILIALGVVSIITRFFGFTGLPSGAVFLFVIGVVIILVAIYSAVRAGRRNPRP